MQPTPRRSIAAYFAVSGVVCAAALVIVGNTRDLNVVWANEVTLMPLAGMSAGLAGLALPGWMGQGGRNGWLLAFSGFVLATALGAAVAGTLLLPVLGTLIAPMLLLENAIEYPFFGMSWLLIFAALQIGAIKIRG